MDYKAIVNALEFSEDVMHACEVVHNNSGCERCIDGYGCLAECQACEMHMIPRETWQEFFELAEDIESVLDFEAACTPDRSDWDER